MKRHYSLKNINEIQSVFNNKKSFGNKYFSIHYKKHDYPNFKFLISIGRKFGNAVSRNIIKRQIRSIIRDNKDNIKNNYSFVIVVKPNSNVLKYIEIKQIINKLLLKTNLKIEEEI